MTTLIMGIDNNETLKFITVMVNDSSDLSFSCMDNNSHAQLPYKHPFLLFNFIIKILGIW